MKNTKLCYIDLDYCTYVTENKQSKYSIRQRS